MHIPLRNTIWVLLSRACGPRHEGENRCSLKFLEPQRNESHKEKPRGQPGECSHVQMKKSVRANGSPLPKHTGHRPLGAKALRAPKLTANSLLRLL